MTLRRTIGIAVVVGGILAWRFHSVHAWPLTALLVLWFSLGGHWVEIWFLNWLRPRLSAGRAEQVAARVLVWFAGGALLGCGIAWTMRLLVVHGMKPPSWWAAGFAFIGVELIAHTALTLRGRPSFYNGAG